MVRSYRYVEFEYIFFSDVYYIAVLLSSADRVEDDAAVGFINVERCIRVSAAFQHIAVSGNVLRAFRPAAFSAGRSVAETFNDDFVVKLKLNGFFRGFRFFAVVYHINELFRAFEIGPGRKSGFGNFNDGREIPLQIRVFFVAVTVGSRTSRRGLSARSKSEHGHRRDEQSQNSHHHLFHIRYLLVDILSKFIRRPFRFIEGKKTDGIIFNCLISCFTGYHSLSPPTDTFPMSFSEVNKNTTRMGIIKRKQVASVSGVLVPAMLVVSVVNLYKP